MQHKSHVAVAGHLCLDIAPQLAQLPHERLMALLQPGRLVRVGAARIVNGGAVANTGLMLHQLGIPTRLVARIGDDPLAAVVRALIAAYDQRLTADLAVDRHAATSYTIVLNPPGVDRMFLYFPGANDQFEAADVTDELLRQVGLLHIGYPPLMRRLYEDNGAELVRILRRARDHDVTTALDLSFPDPESPGGQADWRAILAAALPLVDIFLPSIEELLFMLRRALYERLAAHGAIIPQITPELLRDLGDELLALGVPLALIKLGERGLYLRAGDPARVAANAPIVRAAWTERELWHPAFRVAVGATTGAGDAAIAGFLAALLEGGEPEDALRLAAAAGAGRVEPRAPGEHLPARATLEQRIATAWQQLPIDLAHAEWRWNATQRIWERDGPHVDRSA